MNIDWDWAMEHHRDIHTIDLTHPGSAIPRLLPIERADIQILNAYVKPLYQPTTDPIAMSVGYSAIMEGMILKTFHTGSFGVDANAIKVVGCNIYDGMPHPRIDTLDLQISGRFTGDARQEYTWIKPFIELGLENKFSYDFTYIRNPDLLDIRDWTAIFQRALSMTLNTGVVVTLIQGDDVDPFRDLQNELADRAKVSPLLVKEMEPLIDGDSLRQHHLLAVFRGQSLR